MVLSRWFIGSSLVLALSGVSVAQPADRPAAFVAGATAAAGLAPVGSRLIEAALERDDGVWVLEYEFLNALNSKVEVKLNAFTLAQIEVESRPLSTGEVAKYTALSNTFGSITTTFPQAVASAAERTPAGFLLTEIELELQGGVPVYQFNFYLGGDEDAEKARVRVNATDGSTTIPGGGTGGGGTNPTSTLQQILDAALARYPGATLLEIEYDRDDAQWEVKLIVGSGASFTPRELKYSADGTLLSDKIRNRSRDDKAEDRLKSRGLPANSVSLAQAASVALNANPGFTLVSSEWEREGSVVVAKITLADSVGQKVVFVSSAGVITSGPAPTNPAAPAPATAFDLNAVIAAAQGAVPGGIVAEIDLELEAGRWIYEIKIAQNQPVRLTKVLVEARTARVLGTASIAPGASYLQRLNAIFANRAQITRTFGRAQAAALATLGSGYVTAIELERKSGGGFEYRVTAVVDGKEFELAVDAGTLAVSPR
jgi:uncharacterized membrane protein YkoI